MEEIIKQLRTILSAKDFILTGSYALSKFGLMDSSEVSDIDVILVQPDPSTIETINRLMTEYPAKTKPKALPVPEVQEGRVRKVTQPLKAIFVFNGVKIDVFVTENTTKTKPKALPVPEVQEGRVRKVTQPLKAIFMFNGVKVDVFVTENTTHETVNIDGVKFSTISHIISAKKSYGRMKDWLQCRDMARRIFRQEEFDKMLNNGWKSSLRSTYEA